MTLSRHQRAARAQEQAAAIAAHNAANITPKPDGNRAQRRAHQRLVNRAAKRDARKEREA